MRAFAIQEYGDASVFKEIEMDTPKIGVDQVLIKVHASSLNPKELMQRQGFMHDPLPAVLGSDFAGVVETAGASANGLQAGDKVYGCAGGIAGQQGTLADFIAVDAVQVAKMPSNLNFVQAAALPLVAITAWEGLVDKANVKAGDNVLVHGGTGGVGHLALQLAKVKGATVSATVGSDENAEQARQLGADHVINYKTTEVEDYVAEFANGSGFDIVFDTIGGDNFVKSEQATRAHGQLLATQMFAEFNLFAAASKGLSLHLVMMLVPIFSGIGRAHHGEILSEITKLVESTAIKPLLHKDVYTFGDIAKAHQALENGEVRGKLVLENETWAS